MERLSLDLPTLYGDHHVLEVRQILLELPGIAEIYASSCFHFAEITYDPTILGQDVIKSRLEAAGYFAELDTPSESGIPVYGVESDRRYLRHTSTYPQTDNVVGFSQEVLKRGRPLWPCPGLGVVHNDQEREEYG